VNTPWKPPTDDQIASATLIKITSAALLSARLGGCTCKPWISLRRDGYGIFHAEIAHDNWCEHPSQQKGRDA
jgi:hypothetical protein